MKADGELIPRRIGHLGPPRTHGEEAIRAALGAAATNRTLVPLESNAAVVHAVEAGEIEAGFVPIENSFEGESRRHSRFVAMGHTPGTVVIPPATINVAASKEFPFTRDLRRD